MAFLTIDIIAEFVVAFPAPFGQVGVFGREEFEFFAGVVSEYLLFWVAGAGVSPFGGFVAVALRVVLAQHLHHLAPAVPAVGRQVFVPELVARRQGNAIERGVRLPHALIAGGAVLQVVLVAVRLPFVGTYV